jgi:parallel beta-helix repeat protein
VFTSKKIALYLCLACVLVLTATACSSPKEDAKPLVLNVSSGDDLQKAINAAKPGDVVLIEEGTYSGDIVVSTNDITIRGADRNNVVIDGNYEQDNGIIVSADGVRVENLTVQKFRTNGLLVAGGYGDEVIEGEDTIIERYSVTYVNALNNGLYGIYAFASVDGTIANTFSTANADAGIYIGQCKPCRAQVFNNIAHGNGIGLQGANASKELSIFNNNFSDNRTGIHMLSETKEKEAPQEDVQIVSNRLDSNNNANTPTTTPDLFGFGIVIAGGRNNVIDRNRTDDNVQVGILITAQGEFLSENNIVRGNGSKGNGVPFGFDLAYLIEGRPDVMSSGNCFEDNEYGSSSIDRIQENLPCEGAAPGPFKSQPLKSYDIPPAVSYSSIAVVPQTRQSMPGDLTAIPTKLEKVTMRDLSDLRLPVAKP